MKCRIICIALLLNSIIAFSQQNVLQRPKLVVGIVVDQMRQEYLYRFQSKFSTGGFARLMNDGFMMTNAHYNYVPTFTGPGHASIYTGSTPAIHGIIGNEFYDKSNHRIVNCVEDNRYAAVGVKDIKNTNGEVSPARLLTTTITDELRISTQKKSKVIGISLKDRAAVFPAGHMANGAYWFDTKTGHFISSTYYMSKLPEWLEKFNALGLPDKYLNQQWNTLLPIEQYTESGVDDSPYETIIDGKLKPTFPYNLKELRKKKKDFGLLTFTPFANDYLTEFSLAAIHNEQLGKGEVSDFLTISFSTPDIIGHSMGPNSIELEDAYLRLDKNIGDILSSLDKEVGEGNYTIFLTADHGVAEVSQYLMDSKVPAGYFNEAKAKDELKVFLEKYFPGKNIIQDISNFQVFLNQEAFNENPRSSGVDMLIATELVSKFFLAQDGVANVYTESSLRQANYGEDGIRGMVIRGYNAKRSGDVCFVLEPGWMEWGKPQGSTHGSPYSYDTNVPMLFYGFGIKKGRSVAYHPITDIAPTLSSLLKIKFPNGCTGQPIAEVLSGN